MKPKSEKQRPISAKARSTFANALLSADGQESIAMNYHHRLPEAGFVRMRALIAPYGPIPASRSSIYSWIRAGRFPAPVPIGPGRIKGFRVEDVRAFLEQPNAEIVAATSDAAHSQDETA